MNRRRAVKNIVIAYGGLISLPFWMQACGISDQTTHSSSFSPDEQNLLAKLSDTIIPAGTSVGALTVGVDKYLQKLIDDCYEKPVQENVKKQLDGLESAAGKNYGKHFADCSQQQREMLFLKLSTSSNKDEKDFFDLVKSETIRGFNTSQKVMEEYLQYKVAPGYYYGCVNINA